MRVILAFAVAAVILTGCQSSATPDPSPGPVATVDPCKIASKLPAYTVTYSDGTEVSVPSGNDLVKEASMDGLNGADLTRACRAFIADYNAPRS